MVCVRNVGVVDLLILSKILTAKLLSKANCPESKSSLWKESLK
jgi:hypothetical protein